MTMAAGFDRAGLRHAGLLAETGQGIVFAEEGDHGAAFAPFAHQRRGDARDILGDAEALMAQLGQMLGGGSRLGVAHFRRRPDFVAQGDETRLDEVHAAPDVAAVVHSLVPASKVEESDGYQLRRSFTSNNRLLTVSKMMRISRGSGSIVRKNETAENRTNAD